MSDIHPPDEAALDGIKDAQITATDLALYIVSTPPQQLAIIRRHKYPTGHPPRQYSAARASITDYLASHHRDATLLAAEVERLTEIANQNTTKPSLREESLRSIAAINAFLEGGQDLSELRKTSFSRMTTKLPPIDIRGVSVKVTFALIATKKVKGVDNVGGVILKLTQPETGDSAIGKREEIGKLIATLAFLQCQANMPETPPVHPSLCMAIDVQQKRVYSTNSRDRRITQINTACQMIAAIWPSL